MTELPENSLRAALRAVEAELASATSRLEKLTRMQAALREGLDDPGLFTHAEDRTAALAPEPTTEPDPRAALLERRTELGDQIHALFAGSPGGTAWRAGEIARQVLTDNATRSQIESVRTSAQRLVDKGVLVKNDDASFSLAEGSASS